MFKKSALLLLLVLVFSAACSGGQKDEEPTVFRSEFETGNEQVRVAAAEAEDARKAAIYDAYFANRPKLEDDVEFRQEMLARVPVRAMAGSVSVIAITDEDKRKAAEDFTKEEKKAAIIEAVGDAAVATRQSVQDKLIKDQQEAALDAIGKCSMCEFRRRMESEYKDRRLRELAAKAASARWERQEAARVAQLNAKTAPSSGESLPREVNGDDRREARGNHRGIGTAAHGKYGESVTQ
jgi:hypothetical protein